MDLQIQTVHIHHIPLIYLPHHLESCHFQLKTLAQTDTGQKLSVHLFKYARNTYGKFGFKERRAFPCTWGMNEKAGMDAVELDKYFMNAILPLFPDVEDVPKKR